MLSHISHAWLCVTPWTIAHQAPLSMVFSRQEYWGGLPCPPPGDLPDPGIKPASLLHWQVGSLPLAPPGKTHTMSLVLIYLLTGSSNLLVTFVQLPHLLIITNLISFFLWVCLFLKCSWPATQCQFLVHTIVIRYFYTFPNDHHQKCNLKCFWLQWGEWG